MSSERARWRACVRLKACIAESVSEAWGASFGVECVVCVHGRSVGSTAVHAALVYGAHTFEALQQISVKKNEVYIFSEECLLTGFTVFQVVWLQGSLSLLWAWAYFSSLSSMSLLFSFSVASDLLEKSWYSIDGTQVVVHDFVKLATISNKIVVGNVPVGRGCSKREVVAHLKDREHSGGGRICSSSRLTPTGEMTVTYEKDDGKDDMSA